MGAHQGYVAIEFEMELDEGGISRGARTQIMQIADIGVGQRDISDLAPGRIRQFAVHQQIQRTMGDLPGCPKDVAADSGSKDGIDECPAELTPEQQRDDDGGVDEQVAQVMQRVRLDGDGIGAPDDMALEGDEKDRRNDGDTHDHQTKTAVLDRRGVD
jgi:hypothetical protein